MRSYTRHQLKQDAFAEKTAETLSLASEYRTQLTIGAIILAVIVAILAGAWAYINYRDNQANQQLGQAINKYSSPIRPAGTPASSEMLSFASTQERAKVSNAEFTRIADKYSFTQSGRIARYYEGITLRELGDNAGAEKQLQEVASSHSSSIASLAKLALAGLYQDTNRPQQAIQLYKELADHPTDSVGKNTALFELASLYQTTQQPQEARRIYEQMQKDNPASPVSQMAAQKLQALKQ